ncbi:hypothetical protein BC629DRAFT_1536997 [Irpex lacteus]|nr:hypothetical protein BC629DRAFT_1536997 [Irpex lacteus]
MAQNNARVSVPFAFTLSRHVKFSMRNRTGLLRNKADENAVGIVGKHIRGSSLPGVSHKVHTVTTLKNGAHRAALDLRHLYLSWADIVAAGVAFGQSHRQGQRGRCRDYSQA